MLNICNDELKDTITLNNLSKKLTSLKQSEIELHHNAGRQ